MNATMGLRTELYVFNRQPNFYDFKLVPCNAGTSVGALFQWYRYKAVLRTVKLSTALVNSLCFDLNLALRGFTNYVFVLN